MPSTSNELLKTYSPKQLQREFRGITTAYQAADHPAPSLAILRYRFGETAVEAYIKLWLIDFSMSCLPKDKQFTEGQIDTMAMDIATTFRNIKLAELNMVFKKVRTGEYGDIYTTPTPATVLRWFRKYWKEREEAVLNAAEAAHTQRKIGGSLAPRKGSQQHNTLLNAVKGAFGQVHTALVENRSEMKNIKTKE